MDISASVNRGSATCEMFPDSCVTELNKDLEKAKVAYESESQRIKAEYDKEAEILHKRYEALLIEQHRSYTKSQHQVQQNIMKVEWNRQLVEALKLREELAARAAVFAGLSSQTAVQPVASQQAPPQIPGRPQSGGTAATPVPVNTSRVTRNAGNVSPGIASVIMQPPGTSSTRVSTAPVQHPPRYGVPTAPQQESLRYATPAAPQQESPRYITAVESQIARSAEATLDHQIESGAQSDMLDITIEGVDVRLGTVHLSSGLQEQPVANVAVSRPPSLIYLSDSDDD